MTKILFVCTANRCRSPMAAALLASKLARLGEPVDVCSAGIHGDTGPVPPEVIDVMAAWGLDLAGHRPTTLGVEDVEGADLVVAMASEHVRHAVVLAPEAMSRTFALRELVERASPLGARPRDVDLREWIAQLDQGRAVLDQFRKGGVYDVADPMGGPLAAFEATARTLDELTDEMTALLWGGSRMRPAGGGCSSRLRLVERTTGSWANAVVGNFGTCASPNGQRTGPSCGRGPI